MPWSARRAFAHATWLRSVAGGLVLAMLWMLGHAFVGIDHDARIYMGRALADLDPAGVGLDMLFTQDGQSSFSVYRVVARTAVAWVGLGPTVVSLSLLGLVAWLAAITTLVRAIVPGRAALLVLAVAFVLPRFYAPFNLLAAGESIPVPRPLAEAGVLFAMAALLHGRLWLCLACLSVATLLHPIMAAPGFGIMFIVLGVRDRRFLLAPLVLGGMALVAVAGGLPVVARLVTTIDPVWRAILRERDSYLFLGLWPVAAFGLVAVQTTTILVACTLVEARARSLMLAACVVAVLGMLASVLLVDGLSNLLAAQAQFWRAVWVPAALAPVAAGLCVLRLPSCGPAGQIALALLIVAWAEMTWVPLAPLLAIVALLVLLVGRLRLADLGRRPIVAIYIVCGGLALLCQWPAALALIEIWRAKPDGVAMSWPNIWSSGLLTLPIASVAYVWWRWPRNPAAQAVTMLAVAAGCALVVTQWNARMPAQAAADSGRRQPDLIALTAPRAGDILWLHGDENWSWLAKPNWAGRTQGSALVFSRTLALAWHDRATRLRAYGLADARISNPWTLAFPLKAVDVFAADLAGFCRAPDAPAWIVAPVERGRSLPRGTSVWTPGFLTWDLTMGGTGFRWDVYDRYAVVPCARG